MKHTSVKLDHTVEMVNIQPLNNNPLFAKCQIKVCYVGEEPNRNGSIITKDVAREMANSLPGCPIVGYYNEDKEDFEEHNRIIDISNGKFEIKDTTRPYGFIPQDTRVWFEKFLDDGMKEHEYLCCEGVLWVGQYPECQRILTKGNNHSMELDENTLDAAWSEDKNGIPQFFIINEALISKLCILGEENEPCFEGSTITSVQFSFDEGFKQQMFAMMNDLKDALKEGGAKKVFNTFAVEIGDALWEALYSHVTANLANHSIVAVCEEGEQKFAVLQNSDDNKYYRIDFSLSETNEYSFGESLTDISDSYTPAEEPQFSAEAVAEYAAKKKKEEEDKEDKEDKNKKEDKEEGKEDSEDNDDDEEDDDDSDDEDKKKKKKFGCGGGSSAGADDKKKKKKYNYDELSEIPEYVALQEQFAALQTSYDDLVASTTETINSLTAFKQVTERAQKEEMINKFYMLSEEDKADVIAHIDEYSLDDIEAKLSVICVRNKVSFDSEENGQQGATAFNLNTVDNDPATPAWVKAALNVAKNMN